MWWRSTGTFQSCLQDFLLHALVLRNGNINPFYVASISIINAGTAAARILFVHFARSAARILFVHDNGYLTILLLSRLVVLADRSCFLSCRRGPSNLFEQRFCEKGNNAKKNVSEDLHRTQTTDGRHWKFSIDFQS